MNYNKNLNYDLINNDLINYDLIGIGEQTHGELTSWHHRYIIIKKLIENKQKVYILCEQIDGLINELNKKNVTFHKDNSGFYPYILPKSNLSKEHLEITKKFNKLLPHVFFYGIDIQVIEHDFFYNKLNNKLDNKLIKVVNKYKNLFLKYSFEFNICKTSLLFNIK